MPDRLTDEQLRHMADGGYGAWPEFIKMATELLALRAQHQATKRAEACGVFEQEKRIIAMNARAEGIAAERERIAKWFEAKWVEDSGPDWGLASQDERSNWREQNRRVLAYAAAIRTGAKP